MPADLSIDLPADLTGKLERLATLGSPTVVLREQASLSWLLGGRSHVPQTLDAACFDVVVELADDVAASRLTIVTNAIEAPRLRDTELAGLGDRADLTVDWTVVPWWEGRDAALPTGLGVIADRPYADVAGAGPQVAALRRTLTAHQATRLRTVCADAAAAATAAARRLSAATTEYAAAGVLAGELLERALDPVVLLVAGDERIDAHRHPLPTARPLGRRAMLVCCARRHGLIASVTRTVVFDRVDARERDAYTRLLRVEQAFLDATVAGARIGEIVAAGTAAYAAHGFDPHEWHRHHQGGFSGWQPREYPAHPGSTDIVPDGSVVAWNPSGGGWKVEDTCLVGPDGPAPLVLDDEWPTVTVDGRTRPHLLERP
jgi:Xaa-Pro aminopeptidase